MCFSLIMVTAAAALDQREFPCHACQLKLWPDLTLSILREGAGPEGLEIPAQNHPQPQPVRQHGKYFSVEWRVSFPLSLLHS